MKIENVKINGMVSRKDALARTVRPGQIEETVSAICTTHDDLWFEFGHYHEMRTEFISHPSKIDYETRIIRASIRNLATVYDHWHNGNDDYERYYRSADDSPEVSLEKKEFCDWIETLPFFYSIVEYINKREQPKLITEV